MPNFKLDIMCSQLVALDDPRSLDETIKASLLAGGRYTLPGTRNPLTDSLSGSQYAMIALWCGQRYRTMTWENAIARLRKDANLGPNQPDFRLCSWISRQWAREVAHEEVTDSQDEDFADPVVRALSGRAPHFDPDIQAAIEEMRITMPSVVQMDLIEWKSIRNRGDFDRAQRNFTRTYGIHIRGNNGNGSRRSSVFDSPRGGPFSIGDPSTPVSAEDSEPIFPPLDDGVPSAGSVFADSDGTVPAAADNKPSVFENATGDGGEGDDDAALIEDDPDAKGGFVGTPPGESTETATATKAGRKNGKGDAKDGDPSHY